MSRTRDASARRRATPEGSGLGRTLPSDPYPFQQSTPTVSGAKLRAKASAGAAVWAPRGGWTLIGGSTLTELLGSPSAAMTILPSRLDAAAEPAPTIDEIQLTNLAGFNNDHQPQLFLTINPDIDRFRLGLNDCADWIATLGEVEAFHQLYMQTCRRRGGGSSSATRVNSVEPLELAVHAQGGS